MGGIFISYRRSDVFGYARTLHERLAKRFGADRIFMDIDSIDPGSDFVNAIEQALGSSSVALVLIGRRWYQPARLENPKDLVRLEIATAFDRRLLVIPVFFEGAVMPQTEELPEPIRALIRLNGVDIDDRRFDYDVGRLADFLAGIVDSQNQPPPKVGDETASDGPKIELGSSPKLLSRRALPKLVLLEVLALILCIIGLAGDNYLLGKLGALSIMVFFSALLADIVRGSRT